MAEVGIKEKRMLKLPAIVITRISLLFAALSLAACGGGSSGGGTAPVPDVGSDPGTVATAVKPGIFDTIITYDSGASEPARTLISSSGEYAIFNLETQAGTFGKLTFPGDDTFSDDKGTYVFLDETWQSVNGSLVGDASSLGEEFTATFTAESVVESNITGIRSAISDDSRVTMQELDGTYSMLTSGITTEVNITADGAEGTVTGSDGTGCVINGAISIPDPAYNIFEGVLSFSNCPPIEVVSSEQRNGDYATIGYLLLFDDSEKVLVFAGTNGEVRTVFIGSN